MRSVASKVAGFSGVVQGGIRGSAVLPPVEQSVRNVSVPVSASISSSQSVKAAADVVSVHRPAWEIDDWEFAGFEDEPVMAAPMPRIVFGGVPSFQEAKEATAELKDALDQYVFLIFFLIFMVFGVLIFSLCFGLLDLSLIG